jgi:hypothetical protein
LPGSLRFVTRILGQSPGFRSPNRLDLATCPSIPKRQIVLKGRERRCSHHGHIGKNR